MTCNSKKALFICNFSWDKIADIPKVLTLYFINCHYSSSIQINSITSFVKLPLDHISRIYIINSTLYKNDILNFLDMLVNSRVELSICCTSMSISNETLIKVKETFYKSKCNFVAMMENFMCGYNATIDQLRLLLSERLCDLEYDVLSLAIVSHTKKIDNRVLFLFQDKKLTALHFVGMNNINDAAANEIAAIVSHKNSKLLSLDLADSNLQASEIIIIAAGLKEISSLKAINLSNNYITTSIASYIAVALVHNTHLQELDISNNHLQGSGATMLAKGLHITMLTIFCISNNGITEEAADDIAKFLFHNTQLEEFDIGFNELGSRGIMIIAQALQHIRNLHILKINNNKITDEAINSVLAVINCNNKLQEFNFCNNAFSAIGRAAIRKQLNKEASLPHFIFLL